MNMKRLCGGAMALGAALVVGFGTAWACTNLATLNLSTATGHPGETVTVTGSSFKTAMATTPGAPVVLHWNGASGAELATVTPDQAGNISAAVVVPQAQPGYYVMVATQTINGADAYGTPARASFQIVAPGAHPASSANGQSAGAGTPSTSNTGVIALTVALGVLGLGLFGAGAGAFARQTRRRGVPAAAPASRD